MDWQKLGNGMGVACFKLCCAFLNRRYRKEKRRVTDMNPQSFLRNVQRALIMKQYQNKMDITYNNPFLPAIEKFDNEFLHFVSSNWEKVNQNNLSELEFPILEAELNQSKIFDNITDRNAYWLSCGSYEVKTASHYLTKIASHKYPKNFFEAQYLKQNTDLYAQIKADFFPFSEVTVIKFRVPSAHKQSGFHLDGYKCIIGFHKVENYENGNPNSLKLKNSPINYDSLRYPDYYFQNVFKLSFCSCKTGQRDLGFCAHRLAGALYFGTKLDFTRKTYQALDASSFRATMEIPDPE